MKKLGRDCRLVSLFEELIWSIMTCCPKAVASQKASHNFSHPSTCRRRLKELKVGLPSAHAVETQLPFDIHSEAITPGEAGQLVHELDSLPEPHTLLMVQTALGKPLPFLRCWARGT